MEREKQTEEMANLISSKINGANFDDISDAVVNLYEAGYRKHKKGRWEGAGIGDYYCSVCCSTFSGGDEYNFCPTCGAWMKEV